MDPDDYLLVRGRQRLLNFFESCLSNSIEHMEHYKETYNFIGAMCLKSAVQLAIPEKICNHGKPITLPELVSALQLHPTKTSGLNQLMRYLVSMGLFSKTKINEDYAYVLGPSSDLLLSDLNAALSRANSSASAVLGPLHPVLLKAWQNLGKWFLEEKSISPFESTHGVGFWDYVSNSPDGHHFNESMENDSKMFNQFVLKSCFPAFEGLSSVVDVGGGTGAVGNSICEAYPELKFTVFDLPKVVESVPQQNQGNLNFVGGDMFQSIPAADAVLMKWVLHNWSDEDCLLILKNCKDAISHIKKKGKVIIIDTVLDEENDKKELTEAKLIFDMTMMVLFNAKERDGKEWNKLLLQEAGFRDYKITPLLGFRSLIEVFA